MNINSFVSAFSVSLLTAFLLTPLFIRLANRLKVLDIPSARKIHKQPVPLLGGLAVYSGVILGFLLNLRHAYPLLPIIIGGTLILIIGLIDDIKKLNVQTRLIFQLAAALIVIMAGNRISFFPNTAWGVSASVFLTVIWIVGVTNAYNYLDGMDGLLTGSVIINLFCLTVILFNSSQIGLVKLSLIIIAACLGFLPYNIKKAKIFLGDAGSTFLGFTLAGICLTGDWAGDNFVRVSIPILVLGVPIFDMIFTTIMRIRQDKVKTVLEWLKYAGKDHFHHYLVDLGLTHLGAVVFIYFITLSLGISAIIISASQAKQALLSLVQASIIFGVVATLIVAGKKMSLRQRP